MSGEMNEEPKNKNPTTPPTPIASTAEQKDSAGEEQYAHICWNLWGQKFQMKTVVLATFGLAILYSSSFFMQITTLPYIVKELHIDNIHYGYLQTVFGVVQLIGGPIFGQLCDNLGVQRGLILAYVSTGSCYFLTYLAWDYWSLFLSRIVCIFMHGFQGAQTVIAGVTEGQEKTETFGRMGVVFGVGFIFGPTMGALSTKLFGLRAPLLLATLLSIISIGIVFKYIPKHRVSTKDLQQKSAFDMKSFIRILQYPMVFKLFLVKNLAVTPLIIMSSILSLYLVEEYDMGPGLNSFMSAWVGICIGFMNGFGVVWLRRKFSEPFLLKLGAMDLILTYLAVANFNRIWQMPLINPFIALGNCLMSVICDSQVTSLVPSSEQGTTLSISMAANALIRTGAPFLAGYMLEGFGFASFGYLGIGFSSLAFFVIIQLNQQLEATQVNNKKMS